MSPDDLAQPGLGEEQEVLGPSAPHPDRRDQAALRRQEERVDDPALRDVVGEHALEVVLRIRPRDADEGARPARDPAD